MSIKEIIINFLISFMSIFLGMLCTFVGQGMIDRAAERKELCAALELVRTELTNNKADIVEISDFLKQERKSAQYFLDNRTTIDRVPADSITFHGGMVFAEASITLSQDALELLKVSSLFPRIADNNTSMKIIRAYDSCFSSADEFNSHIGDKRGRIEKMINDRTILKTASPGRLGINTKECIKTNYGMFFLRWLTLSVSDEASDTSDIDAAIEAIDNYLGKRTFRRLRR